MKRTIIEMLRNAPSNSVDFKNALKEATNLEIKSAVNLMYGKSGCKGKITACGRELRNRGVTSLKKVYRQRRIFAVILLIKDFLIFLMGAGAAFGFEDEGDGIMLIVPLAAVAAVLGWVWRGLVEGGRK